jgi:hypothetical protein
MEAYFSAEPQKQLADNGFILRSMTEINLYFMGVRQVDLLSEDFQNYKAE